MGLSNQIPSSRLIQPGVVANSSERPASPYEGQCIFQKDTDQLLVWNGSAWVMPNKPAQNPDGLELIKTQTIGNAVTSVTVNDAFSSLYDQYRIVISGVSATSAGNYLQFRLGSVVASQNYGTLFYDAYTGASNGYNRANNLSVISIGILGGGSSTTSSLEVLNINSTASKVMHGTYYGGDYAGWFGGFNATSNIFTSFMVLPSSGSLTGGTISVYGYRK